MRFMIALAALAACGTTTDDRPETAKYIITAILEPDCGRGGCHTAATQPHNLAFDDYADSLVALRSTQGKDTTPMIAIGDPGGSYLVQMIIAAPRAKQMPPDWSLPHPDTALIESWILDGADGFSEQP